MDYIQYTARIVEIAGVAIIVLGILLAFIRFLLAMQGKQPRYYRVLRQELGKVILLGLEVLVAGDIIATVVDQPTMEHVLSLGVIVLIRTFLSISIDVEVNGRFPWQENGETRGEDL